MTRWNQTQIILRARSRGVHLITDEVLGHLPELHSFRVGLAHFFLQHTSASLAINESYDPDVRGDLERHLNILAPERAPHYAHTLEGPDDMPAHIKAVLIGAGVTVPITDGRLNLGSWQGLYLCEHRDRSGPRRLVVTLWGEIV
ncbi:MAG: YjbQ family protein [Caldilineaceae bacterium]|nr:YjbQ family protein [Caldilineaceae bacterium]